MKNDIENVLTEQSRKEIESKIRKLKIEQDYISLKLPDDVRITSVERNLTFNLKELNIDRDINDVTLMKVKEAERDYYKLLNYSENVMDNKEIQRVAQVLKLSEKDINDLLSTGLELKEIEQTGIQAIKDSSSKQQSISTRELKERITEKGLEEKENEVITVSRSGDKTIISKIDEIGEINDKSQLELSNDIQKQLQPYVATGLVKLDEKLYLSIEKEPTKDGELGREIYKAIPEEKLEEKQEKQEKEKEEIAQDLNENPDNIVGIIRVNDRETCSQILNDDSIRTSSDNVVIVRFKNNRFKAMQENAAGDKKEIIGFKATPAFENIAPVLENKVGNLYSNFNVGDITAGKRVDGQKYDVFYADTGTRGDGIGNLIVVNSDGKNNMDMVKTAECGGYEIEFADAERVYPAEVIMESKDGDKSKHIHKEDTEIVDEKEEEKLYEVADGYSGSIEEERELLEELIEIDDEITELQNSPDIEIDTTLREIAIGSAAGYALGKEAGALVGGARGVEKGIEESKENKEDRIKELESRRSDVLKRLGYSQKDLIKAKEEAEMIHTHRR